MAIKKCSGRRIKFSIFYPPTLKTFSRIIFVFIKLKAMENNFSIPDDNLNLYYHSLNIHNSLLVQKGYADSLHFPYNANFLLKKLEHKLKSKYSDADAKPDFLIRLQGSFDDLNSELKYNFFYSINRADHILQLNCLVAELNEKRICYPVKDENDLPPATNVWNHFTNRHKENNIRIIYPKKQIKWLLREQDAILNSIGYYNTLINNHTIVIDRELQRLLHANLHEYEPKILPVDAKVHLNPFDSMQCQFQYLYDPIQIHLTLQSISVKAGNQERLYSLGEIKTRNLNLQKISEELKEQARLSKARDIAGGPPERSGMTALLKHLQHRP
jgi:hypothetical protein